ncbi:MAG: RNA polymerase factor sigma-54 [Clostridia bacterium]|nr:RNA polymerase factor sigma-54 [Clostridia bacterium]
MKIGYQLNMLQTQKLIMTPELRQAINILQLTALELNNYIQEQLLENPLLEIVDGNFAAGSEPLEEGEKMEPEWKEYFSDASDLGYPWEKREYLPFEQFISRTPSLEDFLEEQLRFFKLSEEELTLARFVIGNLDNCGYFPFSIEETALVLEVSPDKLRRIVEFIQTLEPDGIGAKDLPECLIIQLRKKNLLTPLLEELITKYLKDIGQGKLSKIANSLNVSIEEIQKNVDILKTLNPKPASGFGSNQETRFIVPDLLIEKIDNEYIVLVNDNYIPRLTVSNAYKELINNSQSDELTRAFIERKLHSAHWIIKSIEQRRITLYKIANVLVELQRDFLDKGKAYLLPLNLKDVAQKLEVHESTVSRAIANKYIQTPRGLFPLKYFFSSGINNKAGQKVSSEVVKKAIKDIIAAEDPKEPYSDQMLCNLLQQKGLKIARRTVSKYREKMGILSSSQRKRY